MSIESAAAVARNEIAAGGLLNLYFSTLAFFCQISVLDLSKVRKKFPSTIWQTHVWRLLSAPNFSAYLLQDPLSAACAAALLIRIVIALVQLLLDMVPMCRWTVSTAFQKKQNSIHFAGYCYITLPASIRSIHL